VAAWRDAATICGAKVVQSRFLSVDGVITYGGVDVYARVDPQHA
jgi:hypothetical protein